MTTTRKITNDDLWAAIHGLSMRAKTKAHLEDIIEQYESGPSSDLLASKIIVAAARQCIAGKLYKEG